MIATLFALALGVATAQEAWQAHDGAELQALDKVNARTARLTAKVGEPVHYGTLTVTVKACRAQAEGQGDDAEAWLEITDSRIARGVVPVFSGWMFANAPSVSMLEHPVYDIRVLGCR